MKEDAIKVHKPPVDFDRMVGVNISRTVPIFISARLGSVQQAEVKLVKVNWFV